MTKSRRTRGALAPLYPAVAQPARPAMSEADVNRVMLDTAHKAGLDWIDSLIQAAARNVDAIKGYRERYVDAVREPTGLSNPAEVLSWVVNDVTNWPVNYRIDLAVNRAAQIAISTARVKGSKV